ncbi:hypothetical protein [Bacillus sp. FSL K6-2839]|uniref:hypothetical protein n=1 Tax=Bacillus sp. FSL K6-2839 TaxID=2921480 RepID=UPI0030FCA645
MKDKQKKIDYKLQLNEIKAGDDPSKLSCTFVIFDFEKSHNNTVISKEVALETATTIINKPIVAKYNEVDSTGTATDSFGSHEVYLSTDKHGDLEVKMDTAAIGVFTSKGYIMEILGSNGEKTEVLAADAILWRSRFKDACDLLLEWNSRGININTSCELLYSNYTFKDGVEYLESPVYLEGHAILNSEKRGDQDVVLPAYDSSKLLSFNEKNKFEKLVAQAVINEKEGENVSFKKVFELSDEDIRSLLYSKLDPQLGENVYSYICDVYDDYFVAHIEDYTEKTNTYYKYSYTKDSDSVEIQFESKQEVFLKRDWEEVTSKEVVNQLNEKVKLLDDLSAQLSAKEELETKYNDASDKLIKLNQMVEDLTPFKEQYEKVQFEARLNEKSEHFKAKFNALNASDKFETDEVQKLLSEIAKQDDNSDKALLQLNSILVDLVSTNISPTEIPPLREQSSIRKELIPEDDSFEARYYIK